MEDKKWVAYWKINGKLVLIPFDDKAEFKQMCEDIEVSEGEEGRHPTLYFTCYRGDDSIYMPEFWY